MVMEKYVKRCHETQPQATQFANPTPHGLPFILTVEHQVTTYGYLVRDREVGGSNPPAPTNPHFRPISFCELGRNSFHPSKFIDLNPKPQVTRSPNPRLHVLSGFTLLLIQRPPPLRVQKKFTHLRIIRRINALCEETRTNRRDHVYYFENH